MSEHLSTRGPAPTVVTRRRALAAVLRGCGGAALLPWLSSCSDEPERPDPVELLVRRSADRERRLLARYESTAGRHPELASRLEVPRADHDAHLRALVGRRATRSLRATDGSRRPRGRRGRPGERQPGVPASPEEALAALVTAERQAASEVVADLSTAPPRLRRLLASVGGAEASHAALLTGGKVR